DPMTVVARGAAVYAASIMAESSATRTVKPSAIDIDLAYETVWSETTCLVAGRLTDEATSKEQLEVSIEAETGHWQSGWLPMRNGYFETQVHLLEGRINKFKIYLRDSRGNPLPPSIETFAIRHGLTLAEIPLPHSIGAEVVGLD